MSIVPYVEDDKKEMGTYDNMLDNQTEILNPLYELFPKIVDNSTYRYEYSVFKSIDNLETGVFPENIRILIENTDNYYDLSRGYLNVQVAVVTNDVNGTAYVGNERAVIESAPHLFRSLQLFLNKKLIHRVDHPGAYYTIKSVVNHTPDYISKNQSTSCFGLRTTNLDTHDNAAFDAEPQYVKNKVYTNNSRIVTFAIPLWEIFPSLADHYLNRGNSIEVLALVAKDADCLVMSTTGPIDARVKWYGFELRLPKVLPSMDIINKLNAKLDGQIYKPLYHDINVDRYGPFEGPAGSKTYQFSKKALRDVSKLYIAFQVDAKITPDTRKHANKSTFNNIGLSSLKIFLNDVQQYPELAIRPSTGVNTFNMTTSYMDMLRCADKLGSDIPASIDYDEFEKNYPIFCIDMREKLPVDGDSSAVIRIEWTHGAVASRYFMYCILESTKTSVIQTDSGRFAVVDII